MEKFDSQTETKMPMIQVIESMEEIRTVEI